MFWFFFGVAIAAVPMFSKAAEMPVPIPGVSTNAAGELIHTSRAGVTSVVYPALQTTTPLSVPLPPAAGMVHPGKQLMVIPTTITPNVARVAGAVVALARLSGPVGLGLTLLPILCAETKICASSADSNVLTQTLTSGSYKSAAPYAGAFGYGATYSAAAIAAITLDNNYLSSVGSQLSFTFLSCPANSGACTAHNNRDNLDVSRLATCLDGSQTCTATTSERVPTQPDWDNAALALAAATNRLADVVNGLNNLGQPIPIDKPVLSPVSATTPSETTVNRDSAGNIVNTTTTNTTTNISPVTNTSTTNTVNVTQTTNTTTTGPTGAVTSTTVKSAEPPKPDDPEIGFDDVPDVNLERQELPLNMAAPSSWGEGSCPPDPSVSVMGHPIAVPVHVVCDYMVGVRGAVIALFALISAYIVIGVKFEG